MSQDPLDAKPPTAMRRGVRTIVEILAADPRLRADRAVLPMIAAAALTPVAAAESPRAALADILGGVGGDTLGDLLAGTAEHLAEEHGEPPALAAIEAALASCLDESMAADADPDRDLQCELQQVFQAIDAAGVAAGAAGEDEAFRERLADDFARFASDAAAHESLAAHRRLTADAAAWAARDRDPSYLYTGARLAHVEHERWEVWRADPERFPPPGPTALAFLDRSRRARDTRARRRTAVISGLACVLLLMSAAIVVVLVANHRVGAERDLAYSRDIAEASLAAGATDGDLARRLAATAWALGPTDEAATALRQAAANNRAGLLASAAGTLQALKYSPDGTYLVGATDEQYLVWDAATGDLLDVLPFAPAYLFDYERAIAFDGRSRILAVAGATGVGFWDLQERRAADLPTIPVESPEAIALSHDADRVAVATAAPDAVAIHRTDTVAPPVTEYFPASVAALGFDPTEARLWVGLETWPGDETDNTWFVNYERGDVESHSYSTHPVAFDVAASGEWVAVALAGGYGTTAPLTEDHEPQILPDMASPSVFLPDGHTLMGATADGGIGVWDLDSARKIGTLAIGNCAVLTCPIAIAPDGAAVVQAVGPDLIAYDTERTDWTYSTPESWNDTGYDDFHTGAVVPGSGDLIALNAQGLFRWRTGDDGTALAPAAPERLSDAPGNTLAVSPDGSVVAVGSSDEPNVTVIDLDRPEERHVLEVPGYTTVIEFDPSGSRLLVAAGTAEDTGEAARIEYWDTATWEREPIDPLPVGEYPPWSLCVAADGATVYYGNDSATTAADIESGAPIASLGSGLYDLACDGETVVFSSYLTLWRWSPEGGALLAEVPMDDESTGTILETSPDGRYIATATWSGGTWLWEAATGRLLRTFNGYGTGNGLAFSDDGDTLVGFGDQIAVWDLSYLDDPYAAVCDQIDRGLTFEEWSAHVPNLDAGAAVPCA